MLDVHVMTDKHVSPKKRSRASASAGTPCTCDVADTRAPSTTDAVPSMSSSNDGPRCLYLAVSRKAFELPKSSNCVRGSGLGKTSVNLCDIPLHAVAIANIVVHVTTQN